MEVVSFNNESLMQSTHYCNRRLSFGILFVQHNGLLGLKYRVKVRRLKVM
jgi:hypothetical protein